MPASHCQCTTLCVVFMENLPYGWLCDEEGEEGMIVDKAVRWLTALNVRYRQRPCYCSR